MAATPGGPGPTSQVIAVSFEAVTLHMRPPTLTCMSGSCHLSVSDPHQCYVYFHIDRHAARPRSIHSSHSRQILHCKSVLVCYFKVFGKTSAWLCEGKLSRGEGGDVVTFKAAPFPKPAPKMVRVAAAEAGSTSSPSGPVPDWRAQSTSGVCIWPGQCDGTRMFCIESQYTQCLSSPGGCFAVDVNHFFHLR